MAIVVSGCSSGRTPGSSSKTTVASTLPSGLHVTNVEQVRPPDQVITNVDVSGQFLIWAGGVSAEHENHVGIFDLASKTTRILVQGSTKESVVDWARISNRVVVYVDEAHLPSEAGSTPWTIK